MKVEQLDTCQCGHPKKHHHNEPLIGCVICGCRTFVLPASKCQCGHLASYHHSPIHGVACVALHCSCTKFVLPNGGKSVMDKREAKKFACMVGAAILSREANDASDLCEELSDDDLGRVQVALGELSSELQRRSEIVVKT